MLFLELLVLLQWDHSHHKNVLSWAFLAWFFVVVTLFTPGSLNKRAFERFCFWFTERIATTTCASCHAHNCDVLNDSFACEPDSWITSISQILQWISQFQVGSLQIFYPWQLVDFPLLQSMQAMVVMCLLTNLSNVPFLSLTLPMTNKSKGDRKIMQQHHQNLGLLLLSVFVPFLKSSTVTSRLVVPGHPLYVSNDVQEL